MEIEKRRVYAIVDFDALDQNVQAMEEKLPQDVGMMAVIKTNAYGHGAKAIAKHLEDNDRISGYAVATAEEALELRKAGIGKMILILGYVFEKDYEDLILQDIRFGIYRKDVAQALDAAAEKCHKKALIHIKIDTGMHRIGYPVCQESVEEIKEIAGLKHLCLEGIFTHFARADEADKSYAKKAYGLFKDMIGALQKEDITFPICHCCNSAAILELPGYHENMVRAGITLYGLWPSEEMDHAFPLHPILSLYSHIVHIKTLPAGSAISYGGTYVTERESRIATIPVGYGDGYPRSLSSKGYVLVRGKPAPIVGRVCMDQMMVDVTDIENVTRADIVTLIGKDGDAEITVEEIAALAGTFNYEFVCDLGKRIPRSYYLNGEYIGTHDCFRENWNLKNL